MGTGLGILQDIKNILKSTHNELLQKYLFCMQHDYNLQTHEQNPHQILSQMFFGFGFGHNGLDGGYVSIAFSARDRIPNQDV